MNFKDFKNLIPGKYSILISKLLKLNYRFFLSGSDDIDRLENIIHSQMIEE